MKDMIEQNRLLRTLLTAADSPTEMRVQENTGRKVILLSGSLVGNSSNNSKGVSARVFKNGYWGFSAGSALDPKSVRAVLRAANKNANFLADSLPAKDASLAPVSAASYLFNKPIPNSTPKEFIDFAKEFDDYVEKACPKLTSRTIVVTADSMEKLLCTSFGTLSHSVMPRIYLYLIMSADASDGSTIELFDVITGGYGYFGDYFTKQDSMEKCKAAADSLYEELMQKAQGIFPDAGVADVILDSTLAGMLAHEAVGHTVEADLVLGGSVAGHNLGKQVASEMVNLVDFANDTPYGLAPLPVYVDDEGVKAKDAWLIKDGILTGFMNNRETAAHFDMEPYGNARAYSFGDEPLIRMRNTAILPGKDKLEDMIASIDNGYYLTRTGNGQADTTGEFMFGINMGYEIKNGKLARPLRDTTISGVAFDMLKTVTMLSDNITWESSGFCGKKQPMPVGLGGPAVKCKVNIGGR